MIVFIGLKCLGWVKGRNCVNNNVTYCMNASSGGTFLRPGIFVTSLCTQPGGLPHIGCPRQIFQ